MVTVDCCLLTAHKQAALPLVCSQLVFSKGWPWVDAMNSSFPMGQMCWQCPQLHDPSHPLSTMPPLVSAAWVYSHTICTLTIHQRGSMDKLWLLSTCPQLDNSSQSQPPLCCTWTYSPQPHPTPLSYWSCLPLWNLCARHLITSADVIKVSWSRYCVKIWA